MYYAVKAKGAIHKKQYEFQLGKSRLLCGKCEIAANQKLYILLLNDLYR